MAEVGTESLPCGALRACLSQRDKFHRSKLLVYLACLVGKQNLICLSHASEIHILG
jgi:hypothetical protein